MLFGPLLAGRMAIQLRDSVLVSMVVVDDDRSVYSQDAEDHSVKV